jgi:UDP-N-acetylmuramoylalanine--D-glutamate ligase
MQLRGKKVLVLGLGETGLSMAKWLAAQGARVRVADSRVAPPNRDILARDLPGIKLDAGQFRDSSFADAELIAISPGVPLAEPKVSAARERGIPVVGDIELFARARHASSALIAITGSNGKSTVTTMVGEMCRSCGASTIVAGNIGLPVLDALAAHDAPRFYVLELSSFQLETTESLSAEAATVLNISQDHLDRYASLEDYAAAKARIFRGARIQVLNTDDQHVLAMREPGKEVLTFGLGAPIDESAWGIIERGGKPWIANGATPVLALADLAVSGMHNALNAMAALALCKALGLALQPCVAALRKFQGLPHRVRLVGELGGVDFFDDSKGTNVGASVAALTGLLRKSVLIAGGEGKGQDFGPLAQAVRDHARAVVLIGRDAKEIARALAVSDVPLAHAGSLEDALAIAYAMAKPGDAVLLSPACASFDMFRDYHHRGEEFARLVAALIVNAGGRH